MVLKDAAMGCTISDKHVSGVKTSNEQTQPQLNVKPSLPFELRQAL